MAHSGHAPCYLFSMSTEGLDSLRFPVGKFQRSTATPAQRASSIAEIQALPSNLRSAVAGLSDAQLATPYREGGWTVRQVVHHVADSHVNAYSRIRHALAGEWPTIYAYNEARWAEFADAQSAPLSLSLEMIDGIHARWVLLLNSLQTRISKRAMCIPKTVVRRWNKWWRSTDGMVAITRRTSRSFANVANGRRREGPTLKNKFAIQLVKPAAPSDHGENASGKIRTISCGTRAGARVFSRGESARRFTRRWPRPLRLADSPLLSFRGAWPLRAAPLVRRKKHGAHRSLRREAARIAAPADYAIRPDSFRRRCT